MVRNATTIFVERCLWVLEGHKLGNEAGILTELYFRAVKYFFDLEGDSYPNDSVRVLCCVSRRILWHILSGMGDFLREKKNLFDTESLCGGLLLFLEKLNISI